VACRHSYSNLANHDWLHDWLHDYDVTALGNERTGRRLYITHIDQTDLGKYSAGFTSRRNRTTAPSNPSGNIPKLPQARKRAGWIGAPSVAEFQAAIARHCAAKRNHKL
jgi:hypothetical protein